MVGDTEFEYGLLWQDFQHKQLLERIRELEAAVVAGGDKREFFATIDFLGRYMDEHFALEENYMKNYLFPEMRNHQKEHRAFVKNFNGFKSCCIYRERESAVELIKNLNSWFINHIMLTDKLFADYLLRKGLKG